MLACLAGGMGVMVAGALKHNLGLAGVFASITFVTAICGGLLLLVAWQMNSARRLAERGETIPVVDSLGGVAAVNDEV